jgi:hypothetical protein
VPILDMACGYEKLGWIPGALFLEAVVHLDVSISASCWLGRYEEVHTLSFSSLSI